MLEYKVSSEDLFLCTHKVIALIQLTLQQHVSIYYRSADKSLA